jgi:ribonuclease-3
MGSPEPMYEIVDEIGPDHKKVFVVEVRVQDRVLSQSSGRSKKEAQLAAARMALENLKKQ